MKQLLLLVFLFVGAVNCVDAQQDTVFNQQNGKGQKVGWWKKYYEDGTLQYVAKFENDKPVGTVKRYGKNGKLKSILTYRQGTDISDAQLFSAEGFLLAKGTYIGNKKDGEWQTYRADGSVIYIESYKNGLKEGRCNGYYRDGKPMFKYTYSKGYRVGSAVQYYPNGTLMEEMTYDQQGRPIGQYRAYYDNNAKRIVGNYVNGDKEGAWITYQQDGKEFSKVTYTNGYPAISDDMVKKETEMVNSFLKMKGKFQEPTESDFLK
jgi:antitoxin component YwqK of YwqJK toxin-antitoxin module